MKLKKIKYTESLPEAYSYALTDSEIKKIFGEFEEIGLFKTHGKFSFDFTFPRKAVTYHGEVLLTVQITYAYEAYPKKNVYLQLYSSKLKIRLEELVSKISADLLPVVREILLKEEVPTRKRMLVLTCDSNKYNVYEEAWG